MATRFDAEDPMKVSVERTVGGAAAGENDPVTAARVLMIEDSDAIRLPVVTALTAHGFAVEAAPDGSDLEHRLREFGPDLVILDVMLPGRDGFALLGVGGHGAGEDGLGDAADGDAEVERVLHGPDAGALRACLVEDDVDEGVAGVGVDLAEHLGGDLDEVRLELPRFHSANTSAISAGLLPVARRMRSYASAMSCMSAYSMPLCTIFTKWPAPSWPTCATHGSPSATAAMDFRMGPRVAQASSEPPGMIEGPSSAPSSPPETPIPT